MRENYQHGLYEGEEYQFWKKASGLKEKLALLERVPESAINRAANTLLDLWEKWEKLNSRGARGSGSCIDPGSWARRKHKENCIGKSKSKL